MSEPNIPGPAEGQLQRLARAARAARRREVANAALRRAAQLFPLLLGYVLLAVIVVRWGTPSSALLSGAYAVPVVEAAIGVGLLTHRFRKLAVAGAVLMHAFIMVCVGP